MLVTAAVVARAVGFVYQSLRPDSSEAPQTEGNIRAGAKAKISRLAPSAVESETDFEPSASPEMAATPKLETRADPEHVFVHSPAARTAKFRVQFVCAAPNSDSLIMKELGIEAADVPGAIVTAATLSFPPKTIGLRILDRGGHEVFARQKAGHRLRLFRTDQTSAQRPEVA
jgi:hypothetical protein